MSTTDSTTDTVDLVEVAYPGPHASVYVPGTGQIAKIDEPVKVPRELAQRLVDSGWTSLELAAGNAPLTETPEPAPPETPAEEQVTPPPAPPEPAETPDVPTPPDAAAAAATTGPAETSTGLAGSRRR